MSRPLLTVLSALAATAAAPHAASQEAVALIGAPPETAVETLLIHGSTDIDLFAPVLEGFAADRPGLLVRYEQRATNDIFRTAAAACAEGRASADLLISSSIDQQIKLANDGCARAHRSDLTETVPAWANWRDEVFGLTREPAVIVYNRALVAPEDRPASRFDLIDLLRPTDTPFAGRIATYDIEKAGLGYLFAFADAQQSATFGRLIETFGRNGAATLCCAAAIIDGVAEGAYLVGYNVLGSYAIARARSDPRLGVIAPDDYTLLLARAALSPRGSANPGRAAEFIDYALSPQGQTVLAEVGLIVGFAGDDAAEPALEPPAIVRPIPFSPTLLVGLDTQKKQLFLERWRESLNQGDARSAP